MKRVKGMGLRENGESIECRVYEEYRECMLESDYRYED